MQVKVSELSGRALNYAVAMALRIPAKEIHIPAKWQGDALFRKQRDDAGNLTNSYITGPDLLFCSKWESGGPIIEHNEIYLICADNKTWWAERHIYDDGSQAYQTSYHKAVIQTGPTPLVAAMRCYVASKLGDVVDISEEL